MAKVEFNSRRYTKALAKKFKSWQSDKVELKKVAAIIQTQVRVSSTEGVGYDGEPFPDIKPATKQRRRRLSTVNTTSRFYSAARSNITFTGDLIKKIIARASGSKIELTGKGNHKFLKGIRGKRLKGSNAPIKSILKGLQKRGWKILGVSEKSKQKITIQFRRWIRRNL